MNGTFLLQGIESIKKEVVQGDQLVMDIGRLQELIDLSYSRKQQLGLGRHWFSI